MERCDPERPTYGFTVAAAVEAVPSARRQVAVLVGKLGFSISEETVETVELLASEVIANAVLYSAAPCDVAVMRSDERLRVEVTDTDPSLPSAVEAGPDDERGRGLLLVDALADAWGVQPESPGKTTWFEITPEPSTKSSGYDSTGAPSSHDAFRGVTWAHVDDQTPERSAGELRRPGVRLPEAVTRNDRSHSGTPLRVPGGPRQGPHARRDEARARGRLTPDEVHDDRLALGGHVRPTRRRVRRQRGHGLARLQPSAPAGDGPGGGKQGLRGPRSRSPCVLWVRTGGVAPARLVPRAPAEQHQVVGHRLGLRRQRSRSQVLVVAQEQAVGEIDHRVSWDG